MHEAPRLTLLRHAESTYNAERRLNGDPGIGVRLTDMGRSQAIAARRALAPVRFDLAACTRFPRTRETLDIVVEGRGLEVLVVPELDDVDVGDFEGGPLAPYRAWRAAHGPDDAPPGGESRVGALARFVAGYERLLALEAHHVVAVLHDVPIRFLVNALHGADPIGGPHQAIPNAQPMTVTPERMEDGLARMRRRLAEPVRD